MRQCRTGGLLIEVRGDAAQVETIRAEVARSPGEEVPVRSLQTIAMVEVRGLDQWTTKEEVANALCAATGTKPGAINVVAGKLVEGRVKIGLVSCRVRIREDRTRCFQCLAFGHMSRGCTGPDRASACWRYDKEALIESFPVECLLGNQQKIWLGPATYDNHECKNNAEINSLDANFACVKATKVVELEEEITTILLLANYRE
ncbi:Zinc finger, CCHC-type [Cinara cedri]|uniref:Zinc finger, CCHC-type n=1 Tax=Cinara cedri TaxID=506608 RepID=A0A5E4NG06_9HEMI|nr:Zinc finger, CCHC-type [Cinara cedri]